MRLFNQNEKRIIQQLVDGASCSLMYLPINVFDDIFNGRNIGFYGGNPMELIFPYNANGIPRTEELLSIYNEVLERVLLIDYLEKDGLIYIVPTSTSVNELTEIGNISRFNRITMQIDSTVGEILIRCMNRPMYVSETLKDYVQSGFKSLEEQALDETKKQTKYSYWAVVLAIIAIIISLFQTCGSRSNNEHIVNDSTNWSAPLNAILDYMQNNLDAKLEATMNNTAETNAKLADSIVIQNPCQCKPSAKPKAKIKSDDCVKLVRVNTCQDTIVDKNIINHQ